MVEDLKESASSDDSQSQDELELSQDQDVLSSSTESETEDDLLSVVQSAIDNGETAETESQSVEEETEDVQTDTPLTEESEKEVLDNVPLHLQPRFKEVIAEKNEYKRGHEQYEKIQSSLKEMKLSAEETAQGLSIMGLMKSNPQAALEALQPIINNLQQVTGQIIPNDIQQKIEDGYMDEDVGKELARTRADVQIQKNANQQMLNEQEHMKTRSEINSLAQSVTNWEKNVRKTDPDFDFKQDEIDDRVSALVRERGRPNNSDDAVALAQEAYDTVNKRYRSRMGVKSPIRSLSGGKLGGSPMPEPKSLMDAVQNALATGGS
mgnify:CR=1 FL=1|jgi:hypothetical protein|tara:strand:+ start:4853 stop:5818 length:966 start_codon:yes stop_codon:yes gene_type:complete